MFKFRWMKKLIRSRYSPIPVDKAEVWEKRFALMYFFCAWNLLAYVGYHYYKNKQLGNLNTDETLAEQIVRRAKMQNATVYRINNFSIEDKKDLSFSELEEKHQQKLEELKDYVKRIIAKESKFCLLPVCFSCTAALCIAFYC